MNDEKLTATDELRRMLDERVVEWEDNSPVPSMKPWKTSFTSFTGEEVSLGCYDEPKWIMGTLVFHTPEQAIEATLGRGTCHNLAGQDEDGEWGFCCSECGAMPKYGSGEVHVPSSGELPDGTVWLGDSWVPWKFCPNCGAKVVDE